MRKYNAKYVHQRIHHIRVYDDCGAHQPERACFEAHHFIGEAEKWAFYFPDILYLIFLNCLKEKKIAGIIRIQSWSSTPDVSTARA